MRNFSTRKTAIPNSSSPRELIWKAFWGTGANLVYIAISMGYAQSVVCFGYFILGNYGMAVAGHITDRIYYTYYCTIGKNKPSPLPDIFGWLSHPLYSYLHENKINPFNITDGFLSLLPAILLLQLFTNKSLYGKRTLILSRLFVVWGSCCYLRAICLTTTVLPSYEVDICTALIKDQLRWKKQTIWWNGLMHLAAPITQFYAKSDYMFSGHAAAATSMWLFCMYEVMSESWWNWAKKSVIIFIYVCCILSICLTRIHYTADVIIGISISVFCYLSYHLMVEKSRKKRIAFPTNIVRWIESQNHHLE